MRAIVGMMVVAFAFQLYGCAAMFHGTSDQITIQSPDPEAKIYLDTMLIGKGTAMASVKRNTQHTIVAKKEGCTDNLVQTQTAFDAVSLLGILIDGGVVSMLLIDWGATGAMWKTEPTIYHPNPICDTPAHAAGAAGPAVAVTR
ncbi:hypothetical protein [Nitrospira sp. Nam80]